MIKKIFILFSLFLNNVYSFNNIAFKTINPNKINNLNKINYLNLNKLYNQKKRSNIIYARYMNDISRRNILQLIPLIALPELAYSKELNNIKLNKVLVFGASGYTGGDTIRNLLEKDIIVKAFTRNKVKIVERKDAQKNSLVIDNIKDKNKIISIVGDVLKPETLKNIMNDVDAVIFCAASKPNVKITSTPGVNLKNKNNTIDNDNDNDIGLTKFSNPLSYNIKNNSISEENENVEDIGLENVAKEAIKNNVKRLVIVSSICAKCQKDKIDYGETIDRGFASCEPCYNKQIGEEKVKNLYENISNNLSYTIIRPGMLSPGEKRGVKEIEFNQGISKSGIISRLDLSDILISAAETDNCAKKTFEVYYKDTAQPVDMYQSLKTCKELGKSVKECFFGEGYNNNSEPLSIDKLIKEPVKGSIFPSGKEVIGDNYYDMFKKLKKDEKEYYDINLLKSNDIL